ncbi:hypothetical protein QN373_26305, partial [Pseudomonas sp. Dout3]|nr:hypothetical protein [Pseudomonas sp. Dout3]
MNIYMIFWGVSPQVIHMINSTAVSDTLNMVQLKGNPLSYLITHASRWCQSLYKPFNVVLIELPA